MGLVLDESRCCACDECLRACPLRPASPAELAAHCDGSCAQAPCIAACPQGALSQAQPGACGGPAAFGWELTATPENGYRIPGLEPLGSEELELAAALKHELVERGGNAEAALGRVCSERGVLVEPEQAQAIARFVRADAEWAGPFGELIADERLEEIAVIGAGKPVFVYVATEGWREANCRFASPGAIAHAANTLAQPLGRRVTLKNPRLNAVLRDGSRLHATIPPLSEGEMTIRRRRAEPFTPAGLVARGAFSADEMAFLWLAVQAGCSLCIAGNTGSGKTSALNALLAFVPPRERILVIEETPEIAVPHAHCCSLVARDELGLPLSELCADALRMRPDRVVFGEARDARDAHALFDALLSGQARACYATMHARTAAEACARLASLGIPERDLSALDLVAVLRRSARFSGGEFREERRCTEICALSIPPVGPTQLYAEGVPRSHPALKTRDLSPLKSIRETFGFSDSALERGLCARAAFLSRMARETAGMGEFVSRVHSFRGGSDA